MSCRRGTPRNDCSCCKSLAEKVRELYQRCANAIKSINGINPDGANNFDILPGAGIQVNPRANGIEIVATGAAPEDVVKSVNGTTPDADGDVQINTGLLTVNGEAPDADGEFSITAGSGIQINAGTNGIEIENTSQGAIYTGVSPIEVNADNEISLVGWTGEESSDWRKFIVNGKLDKNLILLTKAGYSSYERCYYIPKGFTNSEMGEIRVEGWDNDSSTQTAIQIPLRYLLSNTSATSDVSGNTTNITESNGVITHNDRVSQTSRVNRIGWTSTGGGGYNVLTVKLAWRD